MLVELIGYPGAGKSTLAHSIFDSCEGTTIVPGPIYVGSNKLQLVLVALLRMPVFSVTLFLCISFRERLKVENFRRMMFAYRCYAQVKLLRRGDVGKVIILDEGPVHALFSCLYGTKATRISDFFLARLIAFVSQRLDFFVSMDVPKQDSLSRCLVRNSTSRFNAEMNAEDIAKFMKDESYEIIFELIEKPKIKSVKELREILVASSGTY